MNWYHDYEVDLVWVFAEAESIISKFPQPLDTFGITYLKSFNVLSDGSTNNYICYLLPFWLLDIIPINRETCRRLSLANVFGMLYYFILDDSMDTSSQHDRLQLPLANLLHHKFLTSYQQLFPSSSPFWIYYSTYLTDWAEAVTNENQEHYFLNDPLLIARKASPLKLCSTGACLLMDQEDLIPVLSVAVDHALTTLQMADDWVDWQDDLREGNYNSLIDFIRSQDPNVCDDGINYIKEALYVKALLTPYVTVAVSLHEHLVALNIPIPHLLLFHEYIVLHLLVEASLIERDQEILRLSGLEY